MYKHAIRPMEGCFTVLTIGLSKVTHARYLGVVSSMFIVQLFMAAVGSQRAKTDGQPQGSLSLVITLTSLSSTNYSFLQIPCPNVTCSGITCNNTVTMYNIYVHVMYVCKSI